MGSPPTMIASSPFPSSTPPTAVPSLLLVPPLRYALVEDKLHRGSCPTLRNLPFLARLRLKTLVSLTPEPPTADLSLFCQQEGIELHHFTLPQPIESISLPFSTISSVLSIIIQLEHLPVYVHCLDGRCITGVIIASLRRLQYFSMQSILEEYGRFAEVTDEVTELLEGWKGAVQVPRNLPFWLWEGKHVLSHPTLMIQDASMQPQQQVREAEGKKKEKVKAHSEDEMPPTPERVLQWGKQRGWLYYDLVMAREGEGKLWMENPRDAEERWTEDLHPKGASVYLEALALEGFTMTNTFPRPLHLFHLGGNPSLPAPPIEPQG